MPARLTAPVSCINTIERPTFRTTQIVIQAVTFSTIVTLLYQQHKHRLLCVCVMCVHVRAVVRIAYQFLYPLVHAFCCLSNYAKSFCKHTDGQKETDRQIDSS